MDFSFFFLFAVDVADSADSADDNGGKTACELHN